MRKYFFELEWQTFKVPLRFINKFLVKTTMEIHQKRQQILLSQIASPHAQVQEERKHLSISNTEDTYSKRNKNTLIQNTNTSCRKNQA